MKYEVILFDADETLFDFKKSEREAFRKAFDNFDVEKICNYNDGKIQELLKNEKIIRNKLKINAAINNSKIFKKIQNFSIFYNMMNCKIYKSYIFLCRIIY